jgi:hypothetical protein
MRQKQACELVRAIQEKEIKKETPRGKNAEAAVS